MSIADNVKRVREAICEAAEKSGRRASDIMLVAAAKTNVADKVREAIAAGVDAVGENRAQELFEKRDQGAYNGAPLHFIGRLQSNKAKRLVGVCDLIESVDSEKLLEIIGAAARARNIVQRVLIEVNIGKEPGKSGITPKNLEKMLDFASATTGINVAGLMAIPPVLEKNSENRHYFDDMHKLYIDMSGKKYDNVSMCILSMGMSDSYEDAIRSGATAVRLGSAIFGERL